MVGLAHNWKIDIEVEAKVKLKLWVWMSANTFHWNCCYPNPPVCQGPSPLWSWFLSLAPGDVEQEWISYTLSSSRRPVAHQYLWSANSPYPLLQHLIVWVWLIIFFAVTSAVVRTVAPPWIHGGLCNSLTVPIHRNGPAPTIWSLGTLQHKSLNILLFPYAHLWTHRFYFRITTNASCGKFPASSLWHQDNRVNIMILKLQLADRIWSQFKHYSHMILFLGLCESKSRAR